MTVSMGENMTVSGQLAREALELTFDDLPPAVVHEAKRRVLDFLGCAICGYTNKPSQAMRNLVNDLGGPAEASIIGTGLRTSCLNATLVNGVTARSTQLVDVCFLTREGSVHHGHSGEIIPSILAVGERQHSTGKEVIAAVVLGYQLLNRFSAAMGGGVKISKLGWKHEIRASYVVPLVAGKLLGLDEMQMVNAVGISSSFAGELGILDVGEEEESMARDLRFPFPAYNGVLSALMARKGFDGPTRVFEGRYGVAEVTARGTLDLEMLTRQEGEFTILYTCTNILTASASGHLHATLSLVKEHDIKPEDVARVRITTTPQRIEHTGDPAHRYPKTAETADHSSYYTTAIAIIDRAVGPDQFTEEKLQDPRVRELIDKIELIENPELQKLYSPGISEITTKQGAVYTCRVDYPKGHPSNPLSDAEIEEKFQTLSARSLDAAQIRDVIAISHDLDNLNDIGQLLKSVAFR